MKKEDIIKRQLNSIFGKLGQPKSYFDITELEGNYIDTDIASMLPFLTQPNSTHHLKKELEKEVKGYITVHIVEDTLVVTIQPTNDLIFRYTQNHISCFNNINIDRLAKLILEKHYLTYIAKIFFK